jgi:hypothetical protein
MNTYCTKVYIILQWSGLQTHTAASANQDITIFLHNVDEYVQLLKPLFNAYNTVVRNIRSINLRKIDHFYNLVQKHCAPVQKHCTEPLNMNFAVQLCSIVSTMISSIDQYPTYIVWLTNQGPGPADKPGPAYSAAHH